MVPSFHQIETIVRMQDRFNRHVDGKWPEKNYPFMRAVLVEVAEALDHYGWKWWSKQDHRFDQVAMELMDILGLLVSDILQRHHSQYQAAAASIMECFWDHKATCELDGVCHELDLYSIPELLELLAALTICRRDPLRVLKHLFMRMPITWDEVIRNFCAKTVLNIFRQDHGYFTGTYYKVWGNIEDNEYLVNIISTLELYNTYDEVFFERIYKALEFRYQAHDGGTAAPS